MICFTRLAPVVKASIHNTVPLLATFISCVLLWHPGTPPAFTLSGDVGFLVGSVIIREVIRLHTKVIGFGIISKSNGLNRRSAQ